MRAMVTIKYKNSSINISEQAYEPAEDTWLLTDIALKETANGMDVLEVGTGTGFVSAVLAQNRDINLIATEINPFAASCARSNGVEVIRADLFSCFKDSAVFDLILFNPPYLPTADEEKVPGWLNYAFDGGKDGRDTIRVFLDRVRPHLKGSLLMLISSLTGIEEVHRMMQDKGFAVTIEGRDKCCFEELVVLKAILKD